MKDNRRTMLCEGASIVVVAASAAALKVGWRTKRPHVNLALRAASENQIVVASQLRPGPRRHFIVCRVRFEVPSQRARVDKGGARITGQEAISRQCRVHFSAAPPMPRRYLVSEVPCLCLPAPVCLFPGRERRVDWALLSATAILSARYRKCIFGSTDSEAEANC